MPAWSNRLNYVIVPRLDGIVLIARIDNRLNYGSAASFDFETAIFRQQFFPSKVADQRTKSKSSSS